MCSTPERRRQMSKNWRLKTNKNTRLVNAENGICKSRYKEEITFGTFPSIGLFTVATDLAETGAGTAVEAAPCVALVPLKTTDATRRCTFGLSCTWVAWWLTRPDNLSRRSTTFPAFPWLPFLEPCLASFDRKSGPPVRPAKVSDQSYNNSVAQTDSTDTYKCISYS